MLGNYTAFELFIILLTLVVSLSIHEAMHAYAGYKLGDTTAKEHGRISLNPLKHIDPFATIALPIITLVVFGVPLLAAKPVPFNPIRVKFEEFGAAIIGFAGPFSNLVMAALGAVLLKFTTGDLQNAFNIFAQLNVAIFVFNIIPIPPLDGSRVLYAFAPEPLQEFMASMERYGIMIIFALIIIVPGFTDILIHLNESIINFLYKL